MTSNCEIYEFVKWKPKFQFEIVRLFNFVKKVMKWGNYLAGWCRLSWIQKSFKHFVLIRKLESIYSTDVSLEISQLKDAYLLKV